MKICVIVCFIILCLSGDIDDTKEDFEDDTYEEKEWDEEWDEEWDNEEYEDIDGIEDPDFGLGDIFREIDEIAEDGSEFDVLNEDLHFSFGGNTKKNINAIETDDEDNDQKDEI